MRNIDRVKDWGEVEVFYEVYISHIDWSRVQYPIYHTYIDPILTFLYFDLASYQLALTSYWTEKGQVAQLQNSDLYDPPPTEEARPGLSHTGCKFFRIWGQQLSIWSIFLLQLSSKKSIQAVDICDWYHCMEDMPLFRYHFCVGQYKRAINK